MGKTPAGEHQKNALDWKQLSANERQFIFRLYNKLCCWLELPVSNTTYHFAEKKKQKSI